jgi:hypothetical protein
MTRPGRIGALVRTMGPMHSSDMPKRSSRVPRNENRAEAPVRRLPDSQVDTQPDNRDVAARQEAARLLGSLGGKRGGAARARTLSKKRRSEIAKKAARVRWEKDKDR